VFTSLEKFDGTVQRPLTPGEVKQIAGRAGRFGTRYDAGVVTCLHRVRARAGRNARCGARALRHHRMPGCHAHAATQPPAACEG